MKATRLAMKILLVCVPCVSFAQALGTTASSNFSARTMRLQYAPEQEGGGAIYELSQAYVRVDQDHVFHAAAATARIGKGPLGETVITAKSGIVVNETSPAPTMHLTDATLVWDPTKSTWDVGAEHTASD